MKKQQFSMICQTAAVEWQGNKTVIQNGCPVQLIGLSAEHISIIYSIDCSKKSKINVNNEILQAQLPLRNMASAIRVFAAQLAEWEGVWCQQW